MSSVEPGELIRAEPAERSLKPDDYARVIRALHGSPNSLTRVFPRSITIGLNDLETLRADLNTKLAAHRLMSCDESVTVSFHNNVAAQFKTWADFTDFNWHSPERIDDLTIQWCCFFETGRADPDRLTVTVRLASTMNPLHLLQAAFSRDVREIEKFEIESAPVMCRVDGTHSILGEEILGRVARWNEARTGPESTLPALKWAVENSDKFKTLAKYSLPLITAGACYVFFLERVAKAVGEVPVTVAYANGFVNWFALSFFAVYGTAIVGRWIAEMFGRELFRLQLNHVFMISDGDIDFQNKLAAKKRRSLLASGFGLAVTLIYDVILLVAAAKL
jgi:hypothetical protein